MHRLVSILLAMLLAGCGQDVHLLLRVAFPGPDAQEQTRSLKISAIVPAANSTCIELQEGAAVPGNAGYQIEDQVEFDYPAGGGIPSLNEIGSGRRLFFVEGLNSEGLLILRGCRDVEVGQWAAQIVTVILEWTAPPCQPEGAEGPAGDATCADSKDNDCDGETDSGDYGCGWWNFDYRGRIKLTFDNSGVSDDLAGFPVRVSLDSGRIDYSQTQVAGEDLRFIDADGETPLPHQIEVWDENGTSEVWVRVPQIDQASSVDHIWLYFGNPAAQDVQDAAAVWSPAHVGVWHLADPAAAGGAVLDSSPIGNHGSAYGDAAFEAVGAVGRAALFDGLDDYIEFASTGFNVNAGTVEALVSVAALPAERGYVFAHFTPAPTENRAYIYLQADGTFSTGMGDQMGLDGGSILELDTWYYLAITWDGAEVTGYLDGALDFGPTAYANLNVLGSIFSMSWDGTIQFLNGTLDELRLSAIHRPAGWFAAQNLSLRDAFITYGPIESAP
jgi:hypothetical protein